MIFKELKLEKSGMPDKDAIMKYIDTEIRDEIWKPVLKSAAEKCLKDITTGKDKIMSEMEKTPFNMKKDQCNVLPFALITCIHLQGMLVSFLEYLNVEFRVSI